ncbi:hypothetical protein [Stomatobaculum longum]|uniref:hypothetical protein n=1 Tax=Stomatobaculum longum TaxID=796942 RepID=UPI0028E2B182|nr:hypothetical protein [Stomatobaculum longum]
MLRLFVPSLDLTNTLSFAETLNGEILDKEVILDFSRMGHVEPLPMLIMGSNIRAFIDSHPEIEFKTEGIDADFKHHYVGTMGFFKYISESIEIGKRPGEARGSNNYIPIKAIMVNELKKKEPSNLALGELLEKEAGNLATVLDRGNTEIHKLLTYLIREVLRNIPEHAKTDIMWICGQYWPSKGISKIAIVDEGIGIFRSITQNLSHREYITDYSTALQWALRAGISEAFNPSSQNKSQNDWANSGFGLYMVSEICRSLGGSFCIVSYENYLQVDKQGLKTGRAYFHGTAIEMEVPTEKVLNARKLISQTLAQGEKEARTIRNAFKTASTPSRGLLEDLNIQ